MLFRLSELRIFLFFGLVKLSSISESLDFNSQFLIKVSFRSIFPQEWDDDPQFKLQENEFVYSPSLKFSSVSRAKSGL